VKYLLLHLAQAVIPKSEVDIPKTSLNSLTVSSALRILFGVSGAIAMLIIILAGLRYVLSQGDPQAVAKAKNAIIYAAVGLIISVTAFSIVTFVLRQL
jgi:hypothetical protein